MRPAGAPPISMSKKTVFVTSASVGRLLGMNCEKKSRATGTAAREETARGDGTPTVKQEADEQLRHTAEHADPNKQQTCAPHEEYPLRRACDVLRAAGLSMGAAKKLACRVARGRD